MNDRPLFDVSRTVPTACPVPGCGAIRLPQQDRVPTCQFDLDRAYLGEAPGRRPRNCLNTIDPRYQGIPY